MFAAISRVLGIIQVNETSTHIIIEGIDAWKISRDIGSHWQTSKVVNFMFNLMTRHKLVFPKFFAIDVLYIFETLAAPGPRCMYPKRGYRKIADILKQETWLANIDNEQVKGPCDFSKLKEIGLSLMPHQREFLEMYDKTTVTYNLNGMLLAAAPGSGKTLTGLALASVVGGDVVFIISPKNAVDRVWSATLQEHMTQKPSFWDSLSGERVPEPGHRYYVFHYEALDRAVELAKRIRCKNAVIILDECHNFNDVKSQRTQLFIELCRHTRSRHVLWSSGTPVKAMGSEMIPFLTTVDPFFSKHAEERFRKIFGRDAKKANDILCNRIGLVSFKVDKATIVENKLEEHTIKVSIKNGADYTLEAIRDRMVAFINERIRYYEKNMKEFTELYEKCLAIHASTLRSHELKDFQHYKDCVAMIRKGYDPVVHKEEAMFCNRYELKNIMPSLPQELRKPFKGVRSVIKYLKLKVLGEALGGILGKARVQCHLDMIENMGIPQIVDGAIKKTLIFSSYVEVVDKIAEHMSGKRYMPLVVHGGTNKDLANIVDRFYKDEDVNPLVATYQSLSTAVPITAANCIILTNQPFRDHEREQAISRALRIGQDQTVHVYNMILDTGEKPNISTRAKDIMEWSKASVAAIMGIEVPQDIEATLENFAEGIPEQWATQMESLNQQIEQFL